MSLGSKIKEYRKKTGLTSRDLAALLKITPATMSRYESGKIESVSQEMIARIAEILNCSVEDLISDDPAYAYLNTSRKRKSSSRKLEEEELLRGFYGLSPELQDAVRQICRTGIND